MPHILINCLSRKDRSGDVRAVVEQIRTVQPETAVMLLLFAEIKIKYSFNSPNAIPPNEWGPSVDVSRSHHRCWIGPHQHVSRGVPRTLLCAWDPFLLIWFSAVSECLAQSEVLSCLDQVFICSFQLSLTL